MSFLDLSGKTILVFTGDRQDDASKVCKFIARQFIRRLPSLGKSRKAPAGQVNVQREKVLHLEMQETRLRRLVAAERRLR